MIYLTSGALLKEEPCCKFMLKQVIKSYFQQFTKTSSISCQRNTTQRLQSFSKILEKLCKLRKSCNHKRNINRIYNEKAYYNFLQQVLT